MPQSAFEVNVSSGFVKDESELAGQLTAIWLKRAKLAPMDRVDEARLEPGVGLVGNTNRGGKRQITILSSDSWEEASADVGSELEPSLRRANLLVRGIDLAESRGRTLVIGECTILVWGETRPCELMDRAHAGLRSALEPDWRGGVFGEVVQAGVIRPGDPVAWAQDGETGA